MAAIETHDLTKTYRTSFGIRGKPALAGLNLRILENEVFGFLGQNGAGKTTTIKILCSLLQPSQGEAFVLGRRVRKRATRRFVGYLPENPYFYEYLTPRETLAFYGRLQGLNRRGRDREWEKLSELLDLGPIANQRVRTFSKGMRQRLAFAVALVGDPPVLILDEPMSGLDPLGRRAIRELILQLRDEKKTIFLSSHVLSDVEQICDRMGILVRGRLTVQGRLDELLTRRIQRVEIIAEDIDNETISLIRATAAGVRHSEAGHHFALCDLAQGNEVARLIQERGGRLIEFSPIRESLEDYFTRQQEEP